MLHGVAIQIITDNSHTPQILQNSNSGPLLGHAAPSFSCLIPRLQLTLHISRSISSGSRSISPASEDSKLWTKPMRHNLQSPIFNSNTENIYCYQYQILWWSSPASLHFPLPYRNRQDYEVQDHHIIFQPPDFYVINSNYLHYARASTTS